MKIVSKLSNTLYENLSLHKLGFIFTKNLKLFDEILILLPLIDNYIL